MREMGVSPVDKLWEPFSKVRNRTEEYLEYLLYSEDFDSYIVGYREGDCWYECSFEQDRDISLRPTNVDSITWCIQLTGKLRPPK